MAPLTTRRMGESLAPSPKANLDLDNTMGKNRSTKTSSNALALVSRLSLPTPSDPTPTNPPRGSRARLEIEWKTALQDLEREMKLYQNEVIRGGELSEKEAEKVARAMENVANSHTDPKVTAHWNENAKKFRSASPKERDGIVKGILKGFFMLLASPFLLVGAILGGLGMGFLGFGMLVKHLIYGSGDSSSASAESTSDTDS